MKVSIARALQWVYVPMAVSIAITACGSDRAGETAAAVWDTLPNGAVHVSYSQLSTTPHVRVEANLHLGSANGEGEAVFGEIRGIDVDHEGRILVLDYQASELKAFDANGRFLELLAKSGEGPREITRANGIWVDSENGIWIDDHDRNRLTRLLPDGEVETYERIVPGSGYLTTGGVTRDGRIWAEQSHSDRPPGPPETPMPIAQTLLPEFDQEMATTRRLLERVPSDKGEWKPHVKSFSLGHLAQLVATMPGWITIALEQTALDLATFPGYSYETTETLLGVFDNHVKEARVALEKAKDEDFEVPWSLKHGEQVLFTLPRFVAVRTDINHLVHHRGQLSVYLRLLDVPIPSIYGPTADEGWGGNG